MTNYIHNQSFRVTGDVKSFVRDVGSSYKAIQQFIDPNQPGLSERFKREVLLAIELFRQFETGEINEMGPFLEMGFASKYERKDNELIIHHYINPQVTTEQARMHEQHIERLRNAAQRAKSKFEEFVNPEPLPPLELMVREK